MTSPTLVECIRQAQETLKVTSDRVDREWEMTHIEELMKQFNADKPKLVFVSPKDAAGYRMVLCGKCKRVFPAPIYNENISCFFCGITEPLAAMNLEYETRMGGKP